MPLVTHRMQNGIPAECIPEDVLWCDESNQWLIFDSGEFEEHSESSDLYEGDPYPTGHVQIYPCPTENILYTREWDKILKVAGFTPEDVEGDLDLRMRLIRSLHQANVECSSRWEGDYQFFTYWNKEMEDHPVWNEMGNRLREKEGVWQTQKGQEKMIFCDLDGVLSDFTTGANLVWDGFREKPVKRKRKWKALERRPKFYEDLPWMQDGLLLWNAIKGRKPTILTGVPYGGWAEPQKRCWVIKELGADVPVITCYSNAKHKYCPADSPGAILIDDNKNRKEAWEAMGGTFIHHTSSKDTIRKLLALGERIDVL